MNLREGGTAGFLFLVLTGLMAGPWGRCAAGEWERFEYSPAGRELYALPRSTAMGKADAALGIDGTPHTNPANLGFLRRNEINLCYAGFFRNTYSVSGLSFAGPASNGGGFGASLLYLFVPDILVTRNLEETDDGDPIYDPALLDHEYASDIFFHAGYGHRFSVIGSDKLLVSAGAAVNGRRKNLAGPAGYGVGLDAGVAADMPRIGLRASILGENLSGNYIYWGDGYGSVALPRVYAAVGWRKDIPYVYGRVKAGVVTPDLLPHEGVNAVERHSRDDGEETEIPVRVRPTEEPGKFLLAGGVGLEYTIHRKVALRVGAPTLGEVPQRMAFGAGIYLWEETATIDFAYMVHELAGTYQLGIGYLW